MISNTYLSSTPSRGATLLALLMVLSCKSAGDGGGSGGKGQTGGDGGNQANGGNSAGENGGGGTGDTVGNGQGGQGGGKTGGTGGGKATGGTGGGKATGGTGGSVATVTNTALCKPPKLKLTRVAATTKANVPMALAQAKGDPRMFVVERDGRIRILKDDKIGTTPFLDIRASVITTAISGDSERGLLNMALHPQFPSDPRFYLFYTRRANDPNSQGAEGHIVIAEGKQMSDTAASTTLKVLTVVALPEDHHIGGMLAFGPDGMLYAGTGDGGGMDTLKSGQNPMTKLSKILRIDVDNPTVKAAGNLDLPGADIHSWAMGIRNPYRGTFDRDTGDMYIGDVGFSAWEEVNFVPPGKSQLNFGWGFDKSKQGIDPRNPGRGEQDAISGMEGLHPFPSWTAVPWEPFGYLPIIEVPHDGNGWSKNTNAYGDAGWTCDGGSCASAIMGGYVYRGADKDLYGRYFFGDHVRNTISSFIVKDGKVTCLEDLTADLVTQTTNLQNINGFGQGGDGAIFVHDLAASNIYRIERE